VDEIVEGYRVYTTLTVEDTSPPWQRGCCANTLLDGLLTDEQAKGVWISPTWFVWSFGRALVVLPIVVSPTGFCFC